MAQTYYEILGVAENAKSEEIEAAFKKKAREVHPDTVAPGNAYLREVAAEAFKDLSEAKAVLLDPFERQKYDAKLIYARVANQTSAGPPPPSPVAPPAPQAPPRRRGPQRARRYASWKPANGSLGSFLFVALGLGCVFFVGWLMWSGRTPPLWLAVLTIALGLLSFWHGMRPSTNTKVRGMTVPLLVGGFVLAGMFFAIGLPSPQIVVTQTITGRAPSVSDAGAAVTQQKSASQRAADNPTIVAVDEGGDGAGATLRIWKNLQGGQNYRTRLSSNALSLEAVSGNPGSVTGITSCEFHRADAAGQSWSGVCQEQNPKDQTTRESSATLLIFSNAGIEGSTSDIPEFAMIPVEDVPTGATVSPHSTAEPDLSSLSHTEKQSIESTCATDKLMPGPAEYDRCVEKQLAALQALPQRPDLSGLSDRERDVVEAACSNAKLMQGPAAYYQCLSNQLALLKRQSQ